MIKQNKRNNEYYDVTFKGNFVTKTKDKTKAETELEKYKAKHEELETEFKKELNQLLDKHHASISFSVGSCSDTHGLYDECMVAEVKNDGKTYSFKLENGWYI